MRNRKLREASTIKSRAQRMVKDMDEMLKDKALPDDLRKSIESLRASFRKTWKELATGATLQTGRKGLTQPAEKPKEDAAESDAQTEGEAVEEGYYGEPEYTWVPWGVTSFAQLEATHAAREMADELQERAAQFSQMVNNILAADALTVPDKPAAMRSLFDEFMLAIEDALTPEGEDTGMMDAAAVEQPAAVERPAVEAAPAEATPPASVSGETTGETASLAESYAAGAVLLSEAAPDTLAMLDVQIIRPGWGNNRDNHYYSREMLERDAARFVGAKMFETDHVQAEKSTRTWVSTVKEISRFTDEGAPVARVAIHDPGFAERVRNLAAAGLLDKMECSILANGQAQPFEMNGRKGKAVQAITEVSSVDWVTKAGAGGKALNLAEADAQPDNDEPAASSESAPVSASAPPPAPDPVVIHEQQPETAAGITPETAEAQATPAAEAQPPTPVYLAEAAISEALARTNLPPASVLSLLRGEYADAAALAAAIGAETKRIKEISGSGRPFAMGESSAVSNAAKPIPRQKIEETMDKINSKFFGR